MIGSGGLVSLTRSIDQSEPSSGRCRGICDEGPTHLVDNVVMPAYTDAVNWRSEGVEELTYEIRNVVECFPGVAFTSILWRLKSQRVRTHRSLESWSTLLRRACDRIPAQRQTSIKSQAQKNFPID